MKRRIYSAEYKMYNANNGGENVGDCVNRASSLAFNIDYNEAHRRLVDKMHEYDRMSWKIYPVYEAVIQMKFYNTLPGKIKPRITYLCIDEYHRYELKFSPLPGDHNSDGVILEGDSPDKIRKMIQWYLDDYSRPYQDYDPDIELS